jgi:hypothetical protein
VLRVGERGSTMRSHARRRQLSAIMVLALTALVAVQVASANSPRKHLSDPVGNPDVPECLTDAPNTSGPRVCKVRPFASPNWQAETGEWIIIRTAWAASSCAPLEAIVSTYTFDGKALVVHQSACEFNANLGLWQIDFRALRRPLRRGDHAISTTYFFPEDVVGGLAGTTRSFSTTLTVTKRGV